MPLRHIAPILTITFSTNSQLAMLKYEVLYPGGDLRGWSRGKNQYKMNQFKMADNLKLIMQFFFKMTMRHTIKEVHHIIIILFHHTWVHLLLWAVYHTITCCTAALPGDNPSKNTTVGPHEGLNKDALQRFSLDFQCCNTIPKLTPLANRL